MQTKGTTLAVKKKRRKSGDTLFYVINATLLGIMALIVLYPLYFIIIASFSSPEAVLAGKVVLFPVDINFDGYKKIMERQDIWRGYLNTIIYTVLTDETLYPLQLVLKEILIASESTVGGSGETILEQFRLANQLKYVSVIVSSLPVLCLYPFVQKYFAQGVMIGSLKG